MINWQKLLDILKKKSFLLAVTNFCWNAVQSCLKPTIFNKTQSIKDNRKAKRNNNVQLGCLFSKRPILFVDFLTMSVSIFNHNHECALVTKMKTVGPKLF
jgi:hypothetical protein